MFIISLPELPQFTLKPTFEYRIRLEDRDNKDFNSLLSDKRKDRYNRIRVGTAWNYGKEWTGEIQYQFSNDDKSLPAGDSSDETSDLSLFYARKKLVDGNLTLGRQKISIGSERLLGAGEWLMAGRSFDGVRFSSKTVDAFAFRVGVAFPYASNLQFAGAVVPAFDGKVELLYKHDAKSGAPKTDVYTVGFLGDRKFSEFNLDYEAALQGGTAAGKDLEAWAFHLGASKTLPSKTKLWAEFNAASGGGSATKSKTFDNLLPTNHKFYGSMDMQGWRNMSEFSLGAEQELAKGISAKAHWHKFMLMDATDAWYGASGQANSGPNGTYIDPSGASGKDIGSELDVELYMVYNKKISGSLGLGIFNPGNFVKLENGGTASRQTWGYFTVQFKL